MKSLVLLDVFISLLILLNLANCSLFSRQNIFRILPRRQKSLNTEQLPNISVVRTKDGLIVSRANHCNLLSFQNNNLTISAVAPPVNSWKGSVVIGLIGIYNISDSYWLAGVSKANHINDISFGDIYEVKEVTFFQFPSLLYNGKSSKSFVRSMAQAFSRHSFYFSRNYDISNTLQWNFCSKNKSISSLNSQFIWNYSPSQMLINHGLSSWVLQLCNGFIMNKDVMENNTKVGFTLISRRSRVFQGPRYIKRGVDEYGNVANFVETEQILSLPYQNKPRYFSFVQVRGSIPLLWSQPNSWQFVPQIKINTSNVERHKKYFLSHIVALSSRYLDHSRSKQKLMTVINLIDKKGDQGRLGRLFSQVFMSVFTSSSSGFNNQFCMDNVMNRSEISHFKGNLSLPSHWSAASLEGQYFWMDYHYRCRKNNMTSLKDLFRIFRWGERKISLSLSYFDSNRRHISPSHIIRTNCIDCLDRTNVVQSLLAKWVMIDVMKRCGVWSKPDVDHDAVSFIDTSLGRVVADGWKKNGDILSNLYAGTKALKGDVTKSGKRSVLGVVFDACNSITRYFVNNCLDESRQLGINILLGGNEVDHEPPPRLINFDPCKENSTLTLPQLIQRTINDIEDSYLNWKNM